MKVKSGNSSLPTTLTGGVFLTAVDSVRMFTSMVGMHISFSAYGFWPPNDPRGSWSTEVRAQHLYEVGGQATKVQTRRSLAARPHNRRLRKAIRNNLKYPPVTLTGRQARAVGRGIATVCQKIDLMVFALAVMPDHVHVVVGEHPLPPDELIACLQRAATRQLNAEGIHPLQAYMTSTGRIPTPWTKGGWKIFLDTETEMLREINYVEQNPIKAGLPRQYWSCVERYC